MPAVFRPHRSLLFMPGSNPRALEETRALPADGLIIDLEDAVAAEAKEEARAIVAAALAAGGYGGRELVLRVNPLDTPWGHADLAAAATLPIDAVLLPKIESADRVRVSASLLDALGAPERLDVWCMIETPLGILKHPDCHEPRLTVLVLVGPDDGSACGCNARPPLITALGLACWLPAPGPRIATASISTSPTGRALRTLTPAGTRAGLRRQDGDPPNADRTCECRLRAECGGDRVVAPHHRRARRGSGRRQGCRAGRRQADRKPSCRECTTAAGARRGDRTDRVR